MLSQHPQIEAVDISIGSEQCLCGRPLHRFPWINTDSSELTGRAFDYALYERGPAQINIARDLFYSQHEFDIPSPRDIEYPAGSAKAIGDAVSLLKSAKSVFNNGQWGTEKKNQVLWFGDTYIGVNLADHGQVSFTDIGNAMKCEAIRCEHEDEIFDAMNTTLEHQQNGRATILEIMCTKELGDPFRRDAMKLPKRILAKYQQTNQIKESSTGQPTDI